MNCTCFNSFPMPVHANFPFEVWVLSSEMIDTLASTHNRCSVLRFFEHPRNCCSTTHDHCHCHSFMDSVSSSVIHDFFRLGLEHDNARWPDFIKQQTLGQRRSSSTAWVKETWSTSYDSEYYDDCSGGNLENSINFWCCTLPSWPSNVQATEGSNQALGHIKIVDCIASQCTYQAVAELLKLFMMAQSMIAL